MSCLKAADVVVVSIAVVVFASVAVVALPVFPMM